MNKIILYIICVFSVFAASVAKAEKFYTYDMSGYGIIEDREGSVNIRERPNVKSRIVGNLENGSIVYCYNEGSRVNNFCYAQTKKGSGYIHTSRIRVLKNKIKYKNGYDWYIVQSKEKNIYIGKIKGNNGTICINKKSKCLKNKYQLDIDILSYVAYLDDYSDAIYLTASDDNSNNIVWKIAKDEIVDIWVYKFEF